MPEDGPRPEDGRMPVGEPRRDDGRRPEGDALPDEGRGQAPASDGSDTGDARAVSDPPDAGDRRARWRAQVLADFARWLEEAQEEGEEDAAAAVGPGCDLHTLLSEMAALRQEVRLQSREQARAVRSAEAEREALRETVTRLEGVCADLRREREATQRRQAEAVLEEADRRGRREAQRACLVPLLEVRDALERGRAAAAGVAGRRRWLRPVGASDVVAGYEMALSRFDRTLVALGIAPVAGAGAAFDARAMVAVGARRQEGTVDGAVVEVVRPGFMWDGGEVLRPAEVIVNRTVTGGGLR